MFPISWYVVLLVSIPESLLVIMLGCALYNIKISYKKALLVAAIGSITCYLIRLFNTINGIQTLIEITTLIIVGAVLTQINIWRIIVAILSGVTISGVIASVYVPLCLSLTSTTIQNLKANPLLNVYFFLPEAFIMISLYILVNKFHLSFYDKPLGGVNNETL